LRIFSREANFSFVIGLSTGTIWNWIMTKENFASREKIRKWKTGFKVALSLLAQQKIKPGFRLKGKRGDHHTTKAGAFCILHN
jgi:hypothetical protein